MWPPDGYRQVARTCPTCNGTGINPVAKYMVCPKCKGEKRLPHSRWDDIEKVR